VPSQLLTLGETARQLNTSVRHLRRLVARRDDPLPSVKLGGKRRVREDLLAEWLDRQGHQR